MQQKTMLTNEKDGLHHIEFHTINPDDLLDLFVRTYGFQLIAQRVTFNYSQWLLKSYEFKILISSVSNSALIHQITSSAQHYDILTTIISHNIAREFICDRDTAFNIAIHVKSIQSILDKNPDVEVR